MSEQFDSPKAVGDVIAYAGANISHVPRGRSSRALTILRTGSSGLEHPIVSAVQVFFNKVPQAVIHPDSGEIFFVGVSDKSGDDKPAKLCKLTLSGRSHILDVAPRIEHLMMLGGKVAYVVVEGNARELRRTDGTPGPKECYPLGGSGYVSKDEKFFAFNNGQMFAHERTVPSHSFEIVGKGVRGPRGELQEHRYGFGLNVFADDLFYVEWDDPIRSRRSVTVHWGDATSEHEYAEYIDGSAFCDTDGTVRYVIFDRASNEHRLYSLWRGGHVDGQRIIHATNRTVCYLCSGHHGFMTELHILPHRTESNVTHLSSKVELRGLLGHVHAIEAVYGNPVFILTKDKSSYYLYCWWYEREGDLCSGETTKASNRSLIGAGDLRLIRLDNRVGLEYAGNNHRIDWQVDESVIREFPLFAPVDRLTLTNDGRVLSWHFDAASRTFFITDYTPRTID